VWVGFPPELSIPQPTSFSLLALMGVPWLSSLGYGLPVLSPPTVAAPVSASLLELPKTFPSQEIKHSLDDSGGRASPAPGTGSCADLLEVLRNAYVRSFLFLPPSRFDRGSITCI